MEDRTRRRDEAKGMMKMRWAMNTWGTKGNKNNFHSIISVLFDQHRFRFIGMRNGKFLSRSRLAAVILCAG